MRRVFAGVAVVVVVLILAVVFGGGALLNSDAARGRIVAAIERATGHQARIDGPIGVAWSLEPAFSMEKVALLNPPGFSRPDFVSARRVEARVALLPLLEGRIEVPELWVNGPDALLERDAAGRGNWLSAPPPVQAEAAPSTSRTRMPVVVDRVHVADATVAWRGAPPVQVRLLQAAPGGGPLNADLVVNGAAVTIVGSTQAATGEGVPFEATAVGGGLAFAASGHVGGAVVQPVAFEAKSANLSAASTLAGHALPALQDVVLTGQWGSGGLAGLKLSAGASDLGYLQHGLSLVALQASLAGMDKPLTLQAEVRLRALPLTVAAMAGPLGAGSAMPVQLHMAADGATLGVQGNVVGFDGHWTDATISARIPNLARTAALAGIRTPGLRDAAIDVRLQPTPAGAGVLLRGLRVTSAQGDVAGDLALVLAPRPSVKGSLISQHLDFDAWTKQPKPAREAAPQAEPATAPIVAQPAPPSQHWVIPDRPLSFAALQRGDADLRWSVGSIASRGVTYQSAVVRVLLQDGRLRLDPASVTAPGGSVQGILQIDAGASPPTTALLMHASGLDAAALSATAGAAGAVTGAVDVDLDMHAVGATAHQMAADANGRMAWALTDGEIENAEVARLFGPALRGANIPFDAAGRSRVHCMAVRLDAVDGQATVKALSLDTSKLRLEGDGTLDLATETMDMHLRPTVRLGPTSVAVPVHLSGPWRAPKAGADKGVIAPGRFGISIGGALPDTCGPALAVVHAR